MIDTVIVFGDSFNYGHGCKDRMWYYDKHMKQMVGTSITGELPSEYCWASLLQNEYPEITVKNFAAPGRSNPEIFRDFFKYCSENSGNEENTLIFFQITNPDRIEVASHNQTKTASLLLSNVENHPHKEMGVAVMGYVKWMYHPDIGENQSYMGLLGAYGMAQLKKLNFIWSIGQWAYDQTSYNFVYNLGDFNKHNIKDVRNTDFSGRMNREFNMSCRAPDNHINEKGHEIYYNTIIKPTIQKYLT